LSERRRYRKDQRLRTADIVVLLELGRAIRRPDFTVLSKANVLGIPRLGLIVPKRLLPRAVDRNRVKRMLREWFRCNQTQLGNRDILIRLTGKAIKVEALAALLTNHA
jgi:ribonuclease P protein component